MIYEYPDTTASIRQGDIFVGLPRVDISLKKVLVFGEAGESVAEWAEIAKKGEPVNIIVPVRPVAAIVATQDCDASHSRDITLCEIRGFKDVERKSKDTSSAKSWKNIITQHARINQKWFYLPPDAKLGFSEKMAVDFMVTMRVPRADLEELRDLRKGRLNLIADEHFRERIGEFFRRYPYDEWYPLDQDELQAYVNEYPETKPFPWQEAMIMSAGTKK
jgi:antitoxin (DNA-binding transcriptional repressor) of toxin-antitoxin stability system